jgi:DNA-binding NarL/FixJ family response regulator
VSAAAVTVLVVDDDALMRAGLRGVLSSDDGIAVVGEAADGAQAVAKAAELRPDVVLMDVRMPGLDGISATREVLAAAGDVRVLILTTFEQDDYVFGALRAGASGFLLKRARPEELLAAVHAVAAGDSLLSPSVTRTVIDRLARATAADDGTADAADAQALDELTPREHEVLALLARGMSNAEIAAALVIEESTVKTHVKRVLTKLRLRDRVQAVIYAYECGLARPAPRG